MLFSLCMGIRSMNLMLLHPSAPDFGTGGGLGAAGQGTAGGDSQVQLEIQDQQATVFYSNTSRVWGSAEEIYVDFAGAVRQTGTNKATLEIDQRAILSPWAAKRLALALTQVVENYERQYGVLELDPRKRLTSSTAASTRG